MFGSNPFGQSTSSPFGSQPAFGQTSNASSNPFAPKPFGSTSPFGSQSGGSIFGGMSTGVFGSPTSAPLGSSSVFGASSSPAFGSPMPAFGSPSPAFGAQSGSAFGNSSSASGGSSVFGQKTTFGGFGSSNAQTTPFGGSFQQSQPAFGSNFFGSSSPFGAPSQPSFGSVSTPAFGASTTPAFGSSTPAFGSTASPLFGSTSGAFGLSSSPFGSSTPAFGATSTPAFGATSTPGFGSVSTPVFGSASTSAFASSSVLGFGAPSAPSFNLGSSPAFGQSTPAFGSSPFGAAPAFGAQSTSFGGQTATPAFGGIGQTPFGGQRGGSRVTPYSPVPDTDGASGAQSGGKLLSVSAMPAYKEKSHEELRWEDYQLGDKGGPSPPSQAVAGVSFASPGFGASSTAAFAQSTANPFSSSTSSNPFAPKSSMFSNPAFASSTTSTFTSSPFGTSSTSNLFSSSTSAATSLFGSTTPAFGVNTSSPFSSSSFGQSSFFGPSSVPGPTSAFGTGLGFASTQSSPLFQSPSPSLVQPNPQFSATSSPFSQAATGFGQPNLFSGNLFSSTSSLLSTNTLGFGQNTVSLTTPFQSAQPSQSSGGFNFSTFGQSQAAGGSGFAGTPGVFSSTPFGQLPNYPQGTVVAQAAPITNPFGNLPAMPQMSIGRSGASPSLQYGISNLPVVEKPAPVRISSLLTSRHFSQRRMRLPVRKYHPKTDRPKVPFFNDDEEIPSTPKADAFFIPRENPRALVVRPIDLWPPRSSAEKTKKDGVRESDKAADKSLPNENGTNGKDAVASEETQDKGQSREQFNYVNGNQRTDEAADGHPAEKGNPAGFLYEHGTDIQAQMPKLRHSDYYIEPSVHELAAKERAEPGFCRRVKDFVVGRRGCGSIKFFGETDVSRLDLESIVQFNDREVLVYMDDTKKPPVGQGLNKPAEITLLNIKCIEKKTGQLYTEGPRVDKYKAMLRKKAEDQGAEFVSYDPAKGEWKFRVSHFSVYRFVDEDTPCVW